MISFPNAKINLGLQITGKLPNGYHEINTCLYPIPLYDVLEAVPAKKTTFDSSGIKIPGNGKDNLVMKAYHLLKKDYQLPELTIHLLKNIPMGAGLGGGSSDAAFMLKMLSDEFQLFLDDMILEDYAAQLGSDCPFFIQNQPAIGTGTGTDLETLDLDLSGLYLTLVNPGVHIGTREAYAGVRPKAATYDLESILKAKDFGHWKKTLTNDFEASVFNQHPSLLDIKSQLYNKGALYAAMSGSGATVFGIFEEDPAAIDFEDKSFFTKTMSL